MRLLHPKQSVSTILTEILTRSVAQTAFIKKSSFKCIKIEKMPNKNSLKRPPLSGIELIQARNGILPVLSYLA